MSRQVISTALAIMAIGTSTAHADDTSQPMFKLSGFGTLGASHSSEDRGDYVLDSTMPKGAGLSNDWAIGNDSRIGAQVSAKFTPRITAVLQVISEYQEDNTYNPSLEWANIKYSFSPDLNVRLGRIALPTFLNSDTRDVGYSYPWVHPPVDLYRQLTITHSDGIDATYRFTAGEATSVIKAIYGRNELARPTSTSTSKDLWGIFDSVEYGPATFHLGYQERISSSLNHVTGVTSPWAKTSDLSAGAIYDSGNWFVTGEWIQRKSTTKKGAMYVSAGYRINKLTPYMIYSQDSPSSFLPGAPPPTATAIQNAEKSQRTLSLGTRWDFKRNVDLKLQYDLVRLGANSNGHLINVPTTTLLYGNKFHVLTVAVDFIF